MRNSEAIINERAIPCGNIDKHMNLEVDLKNDEDLVFILDFLNFPSTVAGHDRWANFEEISVIGSDESFAFGSFRIGESSIQNRVLTIKVSITRFVRGEYV